MIRRWDEELKPYLTYSALAHAVLLTALGLALRRGTASSPEVYHIDFIGPTAGIINRNPEAEPGAAQAAAKLPPQARSDDFRSGPRRPLPRPSVLAEEEAPRASPGAGEAPAEASVSADMPNFPYPWYVSQVRAALWNQWSSRMPAGPGEAMAVFTILPGGQAVDLRIESSSGDAAYDYAALSAVQEAGPFPPLPRGFPEPFLKIHVRFRSR